MEADVKQRILTICTELGQDLDSPECRRLREYVRSCPNCAAFVDSVKKTVALYQTYRPDYGGEIRNRLFKKLELGDREA